MKTNERLVEPPQQLLEHPVAIILFRLAGSEGAAKRRGNSGLVGQALDMDDTPVHVKLGRRLLLSITGH